tara:strand:- start:150 stop:314 length:165 start_codon:yes stop_codon:yes gene_type:complete
MGCAPADGGVDAGVCVPPLLHAAMIAKSAIAISIVVTNLVVMGLSSVVFSLHWN